MGYYLIYKETYLLLADGTPDVQRAELIDGVEAHCGVAAWQDAAKRNGNRIMEHLTAIECRERGAAEFVYKQRAKRDRQIEELKEICQKLKPVR